MKKLKKLELKKDIVAKLNNESMRHLIGGANIVNCPTKTCDTGGVEINTLGAATCTDTCGTCTATYIACTQMDCDCGDCGEGCACTCY